MFRCPWIPATVTSVSKTFEGLFMNYMRARLYISVLKACKSRLYVGAFEPTWPSLAHKLNSTNLVLIQAVFKHNFK